MSNRERERGITPFFEQPFALFPGLSRFVEGFETPFTQSMRGVTLYEDKKNNTVTVEAELPGLTANDIDIHVEKGTLIIKGDKKDEEENKDKKYFYRSHQTYSYRVDLPGIIDENDPKATYKDGILQITFNRSLQHSKKIQIEGS